MSDLGSAEARRAAANQYWMRANLPDLRGFGYKRVAVAEFAVELVTSKLELTQDLEAYTDRNPKAKEQLEGAVQRIEIAYPNAYDYPGLLYGILRDDLTSRGFDVIPPQTVMSASAYQRYEVEPNGTSVKLDQSYAGGSDTGRVQSVRIYSVPPLRILKGGGDSDLEAIDTELLRELKADIVLRIRIRAGTFCGHATLERGSVVHVTTAHVFGNMYANRSLVSEEWAIADRKQGVGGWTTIANLARYQAALRDMFPAFIAMAFDSADAAPKPTAQQTAPGG